MKTAAEEILIAITEIIDEKKRYAFLREGEKKIKNTSTNVKSKRSGSNGA